MFWSCCLSHLHVCVYDLAFCMGEIILFYSARKNITADVTSSAKDGNNLKFQVTLLVVESGNKLGKSETSGNYDHNY